MPLTLSWRRSLLYRNQSNDLLCISRDWFLHNRDLRQEKVDTNTMFPLYRLGFTPLWNSYRIGLLFPFKTNNVARFLYRITFTTPRFWKWYKIYRIGFTAAWKHAEYNGNSLIDWFSVKCGSVHVKIGNISKTLNLIERLNKSSKCFEELYYFFIMSDVEKRAILVASNLNNLYFCVTPHCRLFLIFQ